VEQHKERLMATFAMQRLTVLELEWQPILAWPRTPIPLH